MWRGATGSVAVCAFGESGKPAARPTVCGNQKGCPVLLALAHGFEEADARGDGDVQALNATRHGDGGEEVAVLTGQASHAGAFRAHDDADGAFEVDLVDGLRNFIGCANEPDAEFFELVHGTCQVGDTHDGDILCATTGDAMHGLGDGSGLVFRDDDGTDTGRVSGAQTGTEIVRVLNAVEDEHQGIGMSLDEGLQITLIIDVAERFSR